MSEAVGAGAALGWRLLATLEGGSLLLASAALLAYTRARAQSPCRGVKNVLISNTTSSLGKELKRHLESRGCVVSTMTSAAEAGAGSAAEAGSGVEPGSVAGADKVDAIVVVGAEPRVGGLDGFSELVSEDVYSNLKLLDKLSPLVRRGGYVAWACAGQAGAGPLGGAADAFDAALRASLGHVAKACGCEAVWVGRRERSEDAAERVAQALVPHAAAHTSRFSFRNAAAKVSSFLGRWLKIAT